MCNPPIHRLPRLASVPTTLTLSLILLLITNVSAQTLKVLHNFDVAAGDGNIPYSGLIKDPAGNLYGTTLEGGAHSFGTVYRLSPTGNGDFEETILYSFKGGPVDGANPHAPLFRDGGTPNFGIVFKLMPQTSGAWSEKILHTFQGGADGAKPLAGVVLDGSGNVYGTSNIGGTGRYGTVFKLSAEQGLRQDHFA